MLTWEFAVLDFMQENLRSDVVDSMMVFITRLGNGGRIWIALAVILLLFKKTRRTGIIVTISLILELFLCNIVLKPLVARIRPFDVNDAVQLLISAPKDYSFPSGHTGAGFAVVAALYGSRSGLWKPTLILASLIAFSRMYLYVHYPTDILGGILLGILTGWVATTVVSCMEKKVTKGKI